MPAAAPEVLVEAIIDAVQQCGSAAALLSPVRRQPRKFLITGPGGEAYMLWVYAWTLTFGGRPALGNEWRIQMTSVKSPLALNPNGPTVLLGYERDLGVFAGFDIIRHREFTQGSPSVQVDITPVRQALESGLTFHRKSNNEIAIGIRPDQLMNYALNAEDLHKSGKDPETLHLLEQAAALKDISEREMRLVPEERRQIVQTVVKLSRSANFRQLVLHAYGSRCAVTRMQLRLVDAAHILPVGAPGSIDHVTNGIALSPTYHRAYDNGLIYLDANYHMRLNAAKLNQLSTLGLHGGADTFKVPLGKIYLPQDKKQWPQRELIGKANDFRQIRS